MSKQTEALKLAEDALRRVRTQDMELVQLSMIALAAIREALAEQPAQGCEFCSHPLYAGTKCKNCGREQPAPAQQCMEHGECFGGECIYPATQPAQQEPVAKIEITRSKHTGEVDGWAFVERPRNAPAGTYSVYTSPPAQRKPLTDKEQIAEALRRHGLTLIKTASGYDVLKLGQINAHGIKENT